MNRDRGLCTGDTLPSLFVPSGMPEPPVKLRDAALYLVHQIAVGLFLRRADEWGFVSLNAQQLQRFDRKYKSAWEWLREAGVIEIERYLPGVRSRGYRLASNSQVIPVTPSPRLARKFRNAEARTLKDFSKVQRYLYDWLHRVKFDFNRAEAIVKEQTITLDREQWLGPGRLIHAGVMPFTVCPYGRVHTPITRLKKQLRSCLSINGNRLVSIDISNSQPLILCLLFWVGGLVGGEVEPLFNPDTPSGIPYVSNIDGSAVKEGTCMQRSSGVSCTFPPDVSKYIQLCESGKLYEFLMTLSSIEPAEKAKFKQRIFRHVFYGARGERRRAWKGRKPKRRPNGRTRRVARMDRVARLFQQEFPTIFAFIQKAKGKNYRRFARRMQRAESRLMIGGVCKRLMTDHPDIPVFTIHDSILTTAEHVETVERLIKEQFQRYGLTPTLKRE